jgi:ATP-dependent RNA helicase RhlE
MSDSSTFYSLGIAPNILSILTRLGFKTPTPIQEKSIPAAIEGKDLMGLAQTGTGKTLAFGVPMVQAALAGKHCLVVLPTRELAFQVEETLRKIGTPLGLNTALLIGGEAMGRQLQALRRNPMIVIGTPGRIMDHLQQKTVSLTNVKMLVLDEADRMLDMGFAPQLKRILEHVPKERQTMLFSATMPDDIVRLANAYMKLPLRIEIAPPGTAITKITQELFFISRADKPRLLEKLLYEYRGSVLVFSRTKFGAKRIAAGVRALGHTASELHSNKSLNQRREALDGFRNGKYRVLVATDIAARGIDVKGIELVLNYDLPTVAADYVHRIGRTARAGAEGHAISFAMPEERNDVRAIERLMRVALPQRAVPELPPVRAGVAPIVVDRPGFDARRPSFGSRPPFRGGHGGSSRPSFRGGRPPARSSSSSSSSSSASSRPTGPSRFGGPRRSGPSQAPRFQRENRPR